MQIVIENGNADKKLMASPVSGVEGSKTEPISKLNSLKTHDIESNMNFSNKDKNDYDIFMQNKGENP